jgi:hypothetical protein
MVIFLVLSQLFVAFLCLINVPYFPVHHAAVRPKLHGHVLTLFRMWTPSTSVG